MWDQTAFNDLSRMGAQYSNSSMKNLWYGYNNKLIVGILPCALFASGQMFFVQVMKLMMRSFLSEPSCSNGEPCITSFFRRLFIWALLKPPVPFSLNHSANTRNWA